MPVLDSSFLIDLQHGVPEARRAAAALAGRRVVPFQAALEFIAGFDDPVLALHALRSAFLVVMPGEAHLLEGAQVRRRARPKRVGWGDVQVATQAILDGDVVVTANPGDFAALGCKVWDYRARPDGPAAGDPEPQP